MMGKPLRRTMNKAFKKAKRTIKDQINKPQSSSEKPQLDQNRSLSAELQQKQEGDLGNKTIVDEEQDTSIDAKQELNRRSSLQEKPQHRRASSAKSRTKSLTSASDVKLDFDKNKPNQSDFDQIHKKRKSINNSLTSASELKSGIENKEIPSKSLPLQVTQKKSQNQVPNDKKIDKKSLETSKSRGRDQNSRKSFQKENGVNLQDEGELYLTELFSESEPEATTQESSDEKVKTEKRRKQSKSKQSISQDLESKQSTPKESKAEESISNEFELKKSKSKDSESKQSTAKGSISIESKSKESTTKESTSKESKSNELKSKKSKSELTDESNDASVEIDEGPTASTSDKHRSTKQSVTKQSEITPEMNEASSESESESNSEDESVTASSKSDDGTESSECRGNKPTITQLLTEIKTTIHYKPPQYLQKFFVARTLLFDDAYLSDKDIFAANIDYEQKTDATKKVARLKLTSRKIENLRKRLSAAEVRAAYQRLLWTAYTEGVIPKNKVESIKDWCNKLGDEKDFTSQIKLATSILNDLNEPRMYALADILFLCKRISEINPVHKDLYSICHHFAGLVIKPPVVNNVADKLEEFLEDPENDIKVYKGYLDEQIKDGYKIMQQAATLMFIIIESDLMKD